MAARGYEFYLRVLKVSLTSDEISEEPAARLSRKLSCGRLIMLVTMATPISSLMKDKNSLFTARDEDMIS